MSVGVIVALAVAALVVAWVVFTFNRLVQLRLACESSWSQIDVALRLRHDLVRRLAEAVAGYARHERQTFSNVAAARSRAVAANGAAPAERGQLLRWRRRFFGGRRRRRVVNGRKVADCASRFVGRFSL